VRLENRLPAEGINASHEHPLQEFVWLLGGAIALVAALVVAASYFSQWLAPRIPFEYELKLAAGMDLARPPESPEGRAVQAELQALADRLAARMALPPGMKVRVGYHDNPAVNAFATLGGQVVFFRGLLAQVNSEDALATVMAHELAHLKHRHPVAALGRGVAIGLVLSLVSVELGRSMGGDVLGKAGLVTALSFNRGQERDADAEALRVIAAEYGHLGGALDLFALFTQQAALRPAALAEAAIPEFLRTHPLAGARLEAVHAWGRMHGHPLDGPRRPLSAAIASVGYE
jgi:beta-barrel assembly-enhancing protease